VVWFAHKKLFKAGGIDLKKNMEKMKYKYFKTLNRIAFAEDSRQLSVVIFH